MGISGLANSGLLFLQVGYLLLVSDRGTPEAPGYSVGILKDGRRVSIANARSSGSADFGHHRESSTSANSQHRNSHRKHFPLEKVTNGFHPSAEGDPTLKCVSEI